MFKRELEAKIKLYLEKFPCVVLLGARQVGKSTLLKKIASKARIYDMENFADFDYVKNDPKQFLDNQKGVVVIDEAQLCPDIFKALRVKIDEDRNQTGRFLLSGSSSPVLLNQISESLAGRVAIIDVPCLSWSEALRAERSNFYESLENPESFYDLPKKYKIEDLHELCFYGLYPEPFLKRNDNEFYRAWQEGYFRTYIERDIRSLFPKLELEKYRKFIMMLTQSSGETIKYSSFASALDISEPTVKTYLEIAQGTFIWNKLNAWDSHSKKRLIKMPKGYLRDTVLINHVYKLIDIEQMLTRPNFGLIWEGFVQEQIFKNLQNKLPRASLYYYRTQNKAEIDLIIQTPKSIIPVEIKSSSSFKKDHITNLTNFIEEYSCDYGILINNGDEIRQLKENIFQVPATFL